MIWKDKWSSSVKMEKKRRLFFVFWIMMFIGVYVVLQFVGFSDGDDTYFYEYTHSMGFLEYLGWRYETWVGRMTAEALVYITFNLGLAFWRPVNALMIVLLPMGVLYLATKAARIPTGTLRGWYDKTPACTNRRFTEQGLGASLLAVIAYLLMSAMTLGYAAIWVNGSIFYTWSFTAGIWAMAPFADFVFAEEPYQTPKKRFVCSMQGCDWRKFVVTIPCAVIASMSIEQMGAVLLVFELLAVIYGMLKWRRVHPLMVIQTVATLLAFFILFAAPGNDVRVATEIVTWMPQYETLSFTEHLFITIHWMISSFANENKLFFCGIWIAGIMLLLAKEQRTVWDYIFAGIAAVYTVAALLPYAGIETFCNLGMKYVDTNSCVTAVPVFANMTSQSIFAMIWWMMALIYTFVFLWRVSGCQITLLLAYLAGIASEAIMFFSPTMYASGARVYYLTDWLYLFIIFCLIFGLKEKKKQYFMYAVLTALGMINFLCQKWVFLREVL